MSAEILERVLSVYREPSRVAETRERPLPEPMAPVIKVASGDGALAAEWAEASGESVELVVEACVFFLQQILFAPGADAYRVLGASADAPQARLREHYGLLMRWLHPDRNSDEGWEQVYADRVNQAWQELKTPARRAEYDGRAAEALPVLAHVPAAGARRPLPAARVTSAAGPVLSGGLVRRLPAITLGALGVLAATVIAVMYWARHDEQRALAAREQAPMAGELVPDQPEAVPAPDPLADVGDASGPVPALADAIAVPPIDEPEVATAPSQPAGAQTFVPTVAQTMAAPAQPSVPPPAPAVDPSPALANEGDPAVEAGMVAPPAAIEASPVPVVAAVDSTPAQGPAVLPATASVPASVSETIVVPPEPAAAPAAAVAQASETPASTAVSAPAAVAMAAQPPAAQAPVPEPKVKEVTPSVSVPAPARPTPAATAPAALAASVTPETPATAPARAAPAVAPTDPAPGGATPSQARPALATAAVQRVDPPRVAEPPPARVPLPTPASSSTPPALAEAKPATAEPVRAPAVKATGPDLAAAAQPSPAAAPTAPPAVPVQAPVTPAVAQPAEPGAERKAALAPEPLPALHAQQAESVLKELVAAYAAGDSRRFDRLFSDPGALVPMLALRERLRNSEMRFLQLGPSNWSLAPGQASVRVSYKDTWVPKGERRAQSESGTLDVRVALIGGDVLIAAADMRGNGP